MATLAAPFFDLQMSTRSTASALADAERVLGPLTEPQNSVRLFFEVVQKTGDVNQKFRHLVETQQKTIDLLVQKDFNALRVEDISSVAQSLDGIIEQNQELLKELHQGPSLLMRLWRSYIRSIKSQVQYMDSIAESLHVAADPEATALMALAANLTSAK
jgi:mevalonate kinase